MTGQPRPRPTLAGLLVEVTTGITGRPVRTLLTTLGIAIGLAALVASIGISQSAGARIVTRFHEAQATFLSADGAGDVTLTVTDDTLETVRRRPGVLAAARVTIHGGAALIRSRAPADTALAVVQSMAVYGGESEAFSTVDAEFLDGRPFDRGHFDRHSPVAVLGIGAARRLGISSVAGQPAIFIDDQPIMVIGIVSDSAFFAGMLDAIVIPSTTAADLLGAATDTTVLVATNTGSTYSVATDLPYLLQPVHPDDVDVAVPPPPPDVADAVSSDLDTLALTLAGVGAVVAAISVGAIMTINVVERIPEIGLRRALGASRLGIAAQFLLESTLIGLLGGMAGAVLGLGLVVGAAELREWTAVMSSTVPYLALLLGVCIGLVSGTYPAIRAARIAPTTSLRG